MRDAMKGVGIQVDLENADEIRQGQDSRTKCVAFMGPIKTGHTGYIGDVLD